MEFEVVSDFLPTGDQPQAINEIVSISKQFKYVLFRELQVLERHLHGKCCRKIKKTYTSISS